MLYLRAEYETSSFIERSQKIFSEKAKPDLSASETLLQKRRTMNNYKDIASSICGLLVVLATTITAAAQIWPADIPKWVMITSFIIGGTAGGYALKLVGKNPDGSRKTPEQAATINNIGKPENQAIKDGNSCSRIYEAEAK